MLFSTRKTVPQAVVGSTAAVVAAVACSLLAGCPATESGTLPARFQVHAIQTSSGPVLVRFDSATGALSQAPLVGSQRWQPIGDSVRGTGGDSRPGRYTFDYAQAPSTPLTFIRIDTQAGTVWRLAHSRERVWTVLQDSGSVAEGEDSAPRPRPQRPAAGRPAADRQDAQDAPRPSPARSGQSTQDIEAFMEAVNSMNLPVEMRTWAVDQLGNGPAEAAVGPLIDLLQDENLAVARAAVRSLVRLDDDRVEPALEALREDERPTIRRLAVRALSQRR